MKKVVNNLKKIQNIEKHDLLWVLEEKSYIGYKIDMAPKDMYADKTKAYVIKISSVSVISWMNTSDYGITWGVPITPSIKIVKISWDKMPTEPDVIYNCECIEIFNNPDDALKSLDELNTKRERKTNPDGNYGYDHYYYIEVS